MAPAAPPALGTAPAGFAGAVFQHDAHLGEAVTGGIRRGPVLVGAGLIALGDQALDLGNLFVRLNTLQERIRILLQDAEHIYIVGVRRMYSVAAYLAYAFAHTRKRIVLADGAGGMFREQIESMAKGDVLVAISMAPYGTETRQAAELAAERGASVVAISDSPLSPIARGAAATLTVHESEAFFFRTMPSTVCLAQALFIAVAYRLEQNPSSKARQFAAD